MNDLEIKKSLGEIQVGTSAKKTIWVNGTPQEVEIQYEPEDIKNIHYDVYLRGEAFYCISELNFKRIQEAIIEGAKFVRINSDIVNVNEIKRFKKAG